MPYTVDLDDEGRITWPPLHTDSGKRLMESSQAHWRKVLIALADKGDVLDQSGLAANTLQKRTRWKLSGGAFSSLLNSLVDAGLIERETRGRRTYAIRLEIDRDQLPLDWIDERDLPPAAPEVEPEVEPESLSHADLDVVPIPPAGSANGAVDVDLVSMPPPDADEWLRAAQDNGGVDYSLLATALLERVVEVVSHADNGSDADTYDRATVLSVQLTHANNAADKLRHRVQVLEREIAIGTGRVKSLRVELAEEKRLHAGTEENLRRVLDVARRLDPNAGLDADQRNALDRMLREIPISPTTQRNIG
jgi:hypothetical protein